MLNFLRGFRAARADDGKPVLRQVIEALALRAQSRAIGIGEYLDYGIYRRTVTPDRRRDFIGWRESWRLDRMLNSDHSRVLANDKLINYTLLRTYGYPTPIPTATYSPDGRRIGDEPVLKDCEQVRHFLDGAVYPFYAKPISAGYGRGVSGVAARNGQALALMNGEHLDIDRFLDQFTQRHYHGMLFQKPLKAHPAVAALTGTEAVSCVRFICLVARTGPVVHTAFWKITAGRNMLDNFSHGDYGNCLGAISIADGTVERAIARMGPGGQIERHPTTQETLIGFRLPDWNEAVALVLSASHHFPGLRLQNWDVALTPDGPVLLELNTESELNVPQAITGRGFMDGRLRGILADIEAG